MIAFPHPVGHLHAGVGAFLVLALLAGGATRCSGSSRSSDSGPGGALATGGIPAPPPSSGGISPTGGTTDSGGTTARQNTGGATSSGGLLDTGGSNSTGGTTDFGGETGTGGFPTTGGSQATGGLPGSGGATSAGGTPATGGTVATGGKAGAGGTLAAGGSRNTGGTTSTGGTNALGGATGGAANNGGSTVSGGGKATGGASNTGGSPGTGGTPSSGGAPADRCDVGVYNPASPPQVLPLSGSLATHDPSAIESNGTYYEFETGLGAKTSSNEVAWAGSAVPLAVPAWIKTSVPGIQNLWAPDVSNFAGQYHLYYAGSFPFGKNTSCIGHATRTAMNAGSWTDQGSAIVCSSSANNWNAIDPNLVLDAAETPWLVFGSWWSGIQIVQLNSQGTARANSTVALIAGRGGSGIEGPFMVRRCGYYYLFTSWDTCCQGFKSTYNIRVGRSASIDRGFVDKSGVALTAGGGSLIATGNGTTFNGPGGQSVMIVGKKAYLVYHAYAPDSVAGGSATLRIADLVWDTAGWPVPVGP